MHFEAVREAMLETCFPQYLHVYISFSLPS